MSLFLLVDTSVLSENRKRFKLSRKYPQKPAGREAVVVALNVPRSSSEDSKGDKVQE